MRLSESIARARQLDLPNNPKYRRIDSSPGREQSAPGMSTATFTRTAPPTDPDPPMNSQLQCPMPGITVASDSLRQFYRKGIPQMRLLPPSPL